LAVNPFTIDLTPSPKKQAATAGGLPIKAWLNGCPMSMGTFAECPVLILAGGLGTRLRPIYADGPKVLAPVGGRPFLSYLLQQLATEGFRQVTLCVGYRAEQVEQWLGSGGTLGLVVNYSREDEPMGTGGALRLAYTRYTAGQRFFAINGDSILQVPFQAMYEAHLKCGPAGTIAVGEVADASRYGRVELNDSGFVKGFGEKTGEQGPGLINGGVYLFEPSSMDLVPAGRPVSLEREILPLLVSESLLAFKTDGYFLDIGVPEDLARAQTVLANWIR
jgi:NDP-sugar pyrophosphorylase family protein